MHNEEILETEKSLSKIRKVCRLISTITIVIFALLCIWWVFTVAMIVVSLVNPELFDSVEGSGITGVLLLFVYGIVIGVIFTILIKIFKDTSEGASPFTILQVRRLRIIALMLVFYMLLDSGIKYNAAFLQFNGMNSGYASMSSVATIDFAPLMAAAVVFAFSFVFKYGVLLQELSDETL